LRKFYKIAAAARARAYSVSPHRTLKREAR